MNDAFDKWYEANEKRDTPISELRLQVQIKRLESENARLRENSSKAINEIIFMSARIGWLEEKNEKLIEVLKEISNDTMQVGFMHPYTKGAMIARAALEKHVREIDHINEISTPSTQAENVSKSSEQK